MNKGNIKEVVLGVKNAIKNIPSEYDNYDRVIEVYFESFKFGIKELFPYKYFVLKDSENGWEIAIFDDEESRDKWIEKNSTYDCSKIIYEAFFSYSQDEWDDPDAYREENGVLIFRLL